MTTYEAISLLQADDLTEIGMRADARRRELHPDGIATYSTAEQSSAIRVTLANPEDVLASLDAVQTATSLLPVCSRAATATEYLRFLAVCRLYSDVPNIELDPEWSGLKIAQIALRFGANDFGNTKPSGPTPEEEIRRIIREAGFVPKKRDPLFRSLSLY